MIKAFCMLFFLCSKMQILSQERIAFVIGVKDYENFSPLKNGLNDADSIELVLNKAGFVVRKVKNIAYQEIRDSLEAWLKIVPNYFDVLFYFSGHGVEFGGNNFLLLKDTKKDYYKDLENTTLHLKLIISRLKEIAENGSRKPLNTIILLDACRSSAFKDIRSKYISKLDLSPKSLKNLFVGYSTLGGETSIGDGLYNSPFTEVMFNSLYSSEEINLLFTNIANRVDSLTMGTQAVERSSSLNYFQFVPHYFTDLKQKERYTSKGTEKAVGLFNLSVLGKSESELVNLGYENKLDSLMGYSVNSIINGSDSISLQKLRLSDSKLLSNVTEWFIVNELRNKMSYDKNESYVVYESKNKKIGNIGLFLKYSSLDLHTEIANALGADLYSNPTFSLLTNQNLFSRFNKFKRVSSSIDGIFLRLPEYPYTIIEIGNEFPWDGGLLEKYYMIMKTLKISPKPSYKRIFEEYNSENKFSTNIP